MVKPLGFRSVGPKVWCQNWYSWSPRTQTCCQTRYSAPPPGEETRKVSCEYVGKAAGGGKSMLPIPNRNLPDNARHEAICRDSAVTKAPIHADQGRYQA